MALARPILFHGGDGATCCLPNQNCSKGIFTRFWDRRLRRTTLNLSAGLHSKIFLLGSDFQSKYIPNGFRLSCQGSDSLGNDRIGESSESNDESEAISFKEEKEVRVENETDSLEELKDLLHKTIKDLEVARLNSTMFEEKAQRISERAIALKDEAANAWQNVNNTLDVIRDTVDEECVAKEAVEKATMDLSLAEAKLQVILESLEAGGGNDIPKVSDETEKLDDVKDTEDALLAAKDDIKECQVNLANCEAQLNCLLSKKDELQKDVDKLNEFAETTQINALITEEDVANIMKLAEQAVAFELEAAQRVNDAEITLQRVNDAYNKPTNLNKNL